jgi:2-oxoglutarate dehydrogenase complex dehydrogenase (E1) component-like enzyme
MKKLEDLSVKKFSKEQKLKMLTDLTKVQGFSSFVHDKIKNSKRFGV